MALLTDKLTATLIALSDVHLLSEDDPKTPLLLDLLQRIEKLECLVLNGDIFDFCFGASAFQRRKFAFLAAVLTRIAAQGTRVIFMQGNHEFSLKDLAWPGVELCENLTSTFVSRGGQKIAIIHGDRLKSPWHYELYVSLTRSFPFKLCARAIPQGFLDRLALKISGGSRGRDMIRDVNHREIVAAGFEWLSTTGCDVGIMGHFHVPYAEQQGSQRLFCVESWQRPNLLAVMDSGIYRAFLQGVGAPFELIPIGDCSFTLPAQMNTRS